MHTNINQRLINTSSYFQGNPRVVVISFYPAENEEKVTALVDTSKNTPLKQLQAEGFDLKHALHVLFLHQHQCFNM